MTPEAQRIAIAQACGWTEIVQLKLHAGNEGLIGTHIAVDGVRSRDWVPDYPNDLNAMHEAEKVLNDAQFEDYFSELESQMPFARPKNKRRHICSAKAAHRAEAFLRSLKLWRDDA